MFITFSHNPLRPLAIQDTPLADWSWPSWLEGSAEWASSTGSVLLALLIVLACLAAWLSNLVALPGNWVAVAILGLYAWLGPDAGRIGMGAAAVIGAFAFALLGEIIEFVAGALGASRAGASRRSTLYAIIGSVGGALMGAVVGIPVPVIGPVIAAILFGGIGATAGAMYGEWSNGRPWRESWTIGQAAFWGRTAGTIGKMAAGFGIVVIALVGIAI